MWLQDPNQALIARLALGTVVGYFLFLVTLAWLERRYINEEIEAFSTKLKQVRAFVEVYDKAFTELVKLNDRVDKTREKVKELNNSIEDVKEEIERIKEWLEKIEILLRKKLNFEIRLVAHGKE